MKKRLQRRAKGRDISLRAFNRLKNHLQILPIHPFSCLPKLKESQHSNSFFHIFSDTSGKINVGTFGFRSTGGRLEPGDPRSLTGGPLCWVHSAVKCLRATGMCDLPLSSCPGHPVGVQVPPHLENRLSFCAATTKS